MGITSCHSLFPKTFIWKTNLTFVEVVVEFFSGQQSCFGMQKTDFWIKTKTQSGRNASMNVCRENRCDGSCSVDKWLHIKRKNTWMFILAFVSCNKLCLPSLYKTDSKAVHAPSTFVTPVPQEAESTSASIRSQHYQQPTWVVNDILYNAVSVHVCEI